MEFYAGRPERAREILLEALPEMSVGDAFGAGRRLPEMDNSAHARADPRLYAFLAITCRTLGKLEEARRYVEAYRQALSENPWIDYESARVHTAAGELELAVDELGRCLEKDPQYALAYYRRGPLLRSLGRSKEARADFQRYVELMGPARAETQSVRNALRAIEELR